jgi:hypothetical protein
MTSEDKVALREFLTGAAVAIGITVIFVLLIFASGIVSVGDTELKPSAEVVDTYKGCDIIRWSNGQLAEYKYFLHCNNTRPVYGK